MAVNVSAWLGSGGGTPTTQVQQRAALAWRRIQDKPSSIVFRKPNGVTLAAQTVRVEPGDGVGRAESPAGSAPVLSAVIFGIRGHATLANTDIGEGYRFVLAGAEYTVIGVTLTLGEVQATAQAVG